MTTTTAALLALVGAPLAGTGTDGERVLIAAAAAVATATAAARRAELALADERGIEAPGRFTDRVVVHHAAAVVRAGSAPACAAAAAALVAVAAAATVGWCAASEGSGCIFGAVSGDAFPFGCSLRGLRGPKAGTIGALIGLHAEPGLSRTASEALTTCVDCAIDHDVSRRANRDDAAFLSVPRQRLDTGSRRHLQVSDLWHPHNLRVSRHAVGIAQPSTARIEQHPRARRVHPTYPHQLIQPRTL